MSDSESVGSAAESPVVPYKGEKKAWKHQLLDMEEVLNETPMFTERMKVVEQDVEELGVKLKKIVKICKETQKASTVLNDLNRQLGDEYLDFAKHLTDEETKEGLLKFGSAIKEIASFREMLNLQIENLILQPMETFCKEEIDEVKEKKKKYVRASSSLESALGRAAQVKRTPTLKTLEVEHELSEARKDFQTSGMDLVFALNEIEAKKQFELMERVTAVMYANLAFFHQGYELFNEMSPQMRQLSSQVQTTRKSFEQEKKDLLFYKKVLSQKVMVGGVEGPKNDMTATTIQGYLFKLSTSIRKDWKRRYFVVDKGVIRYYKTTKELTPVMAVNLLLCSVKLRPDIDRRWCFEIISPDKSYVLQADNEETLQHWIAVLQNATAEQLNNQTIGTKKSAYSSPDSDRKYGPDKTHVLDPLVQLRAVGEANCFCADCGAKDPEWTSINIGVLVCIECSGIHRSMGVHISKVRSFTLDKWEPDLLKMMLAIGNANANRIFEAEIPENVKKITPTTDRVSREKYIRMKYQQKAFLPKTNRTPDQLGTDLYHATKKNDLIEVLKLTNQGANTNYHNPNENNKTALHLAILEGFTSVVMLLSQNRADINAVDDDLWTPLHHAAVQGKTSCVAILFKNGAKLDLKDRNGQTPLDLAIAQQKADCVTFLRLAQLATQEGGDADDSFMEALQSFTYDTQQENV